MIDESRATWPSMTGQTILADAFERLKPNLLAMIERRVGPKLAARIDPEGVVQEAFLRARPRWQTLDPKPDDPTTFVYGQVVDRLIETIRAALGPQRDAGRELAWGDGVAGPLVDRMVDSETGPGSALSRVERREVVHEALAQLDPVDREILALRYFDGLNFAQIGAILDLKENTANVRALRAAVAFRKLIPPAFRPPGASRP